MYIVYDARYPDESASVALSTEDLNEARRCAVEFGIGMKVIKLENGVETLDFEVGVHEFPIFSSEALDFAYHPLPGKIRYLISEPIKGSDDMPDFSSRSTDNRAEAIKIADQRGIGVAVCELADGVTQPTYISIFSDDYSEKYLPVLWEERKNDYRWLTFREE